MSLPKFVSETTLQEPVSVTIMRDLNMVYSKLKLLVSMPKSINAQTENIRKWDLWGPFIFGLLLAVLAYQSPLSHI